MNTENKNIKKIACDSQNSETIWINPVGGYGDMLMVGGVLKLALEKKPSQKFKLARRTRYINIFKDHPAIDGIGFPPKGSKLITTDYWAKEELGGSSQRPFQVLARLFGLSTPVEEKLFLPGKIEIDELLTQMIPWEKEKTIIIAPSSDSPRKMMHPEKWEGIVEGLLREDFLVLQVGRKTDRYIKGAYSLLGLTTPHQVAAVLKQAYMVITVDNFIMHAAKMVEVPTIAIFGPTQPEIYGYETQVLMQAPVTHCDQRAKCLGARYPQNYSSFCPLNAENHCMNRLNEKSVLTKIKRI